jgi:hypothetical protein
MESTQLETNHAFVDFDTDARWGLYILRTVTTYYF